MWGERLRTPFPQRPPGSGMLWSFMTMLHHSLAFTLKISTITTHCRAVGLGGSGAVYLGVNLEFPGLPLNNSVTTRRLWQRQRLIRLACTPRTASVNHASAPPSCDGWQHGTGCANRSVSLPRCTRSSSCCRMLRGTGSGRCCGCRCPRRRAATAGSCTPSSPAR